VRTIEHSNLIDDSAAQLMADKGAFLVANLVTYYVMKERAAQFGMTADMLAKNDLVLERGYHSLEICKRAGVPVAYGSDLLGPLQAEQSREFLIRGEVMKPIEVIQSATTIAARVLRQEGKLGTIAPGARADLLVVDGNPLGDLGLFQDQGAHLAAIMKGGSFHKNRLA
jgi:imidazolonepropionase-like amidohydrolase